MNNKGFEIHLNNKLVCKAGIKDNHGTVSCIVGTIRRKGNAAQEEIYLDVSGLNSDTGEFAKWVKSNPLKMNDVITINVITDNFDAPIEIGEKKSKEFLLEQKIRTYKKLKEELKDYI